MSAEDRRLVAALVALVAAAIIFGILCGLSYLYDVWRERELGREAFPNVITTQPNLK